MGLGRKKKDAGGGGDMGEFGFQDFEVANPMNESGDDEKLNSAAAATNAKPVQVRLTLLCAPCMAFSCASEIIRFG